MYVVAESVELDAAFGGVDRSVRGVDPCTDVLVSYTEFFARGDEIGLRDVP